jgi:murein DD-endopeptidase MepM/ murein hydrolase activator NlpD
MDVILIRKNLDKGKRNYLSHPIFVPVTLVSMLTVATVGYSAYSHYSGNSSDHILSLSSKDYYPRFDVEEALSDNFDDLTERVNALETKATQLDKWGEQLVFTSKTQELDMSLSWDQIIIEQQYAAQRKLEEEREAQRKLEEERALQRQLEKERALLQKLEEERALQLLERQIAQKREEERVAQKREEERVAQKREEERVAQKREEERFVQKREEERVAQKREEERALQRQLERQLLAQKREEERVAQKREEERVAQKREEERVAQKREEERALQRQLERQLLAQKLEQQRRLAQKLERQLVAQKLERQLLAQKREEERAINDKKPSGPPPTEPYVSYKKTTSWQSTRLSSAAPVKSFSEEPTMRVRQSSGQALVLNERIVHKPETHNRKQKTELRSKPIQTAQLAQQRWQQTVRTKRPEQKTDFSLSWDNIINDRPIFAQSKEREPSKEIGTTISRFSPIAKLKRSIQIVSRNLLRQYRSRVKRLPEGWPLPKGRVSSKFGWRGKRMHKGIDIAAKRGTPIYAVEDGIVERSKYMRGYGKLVEITHSEMYSTRYGHNSKNLVQEGDVVFKGQVIALVGSTGRSTGPHVHFEIRQSGVAINPIKYLGAMEEFTLTENIKLSEYVKLSRR